MIQPISFVLFICVLLISILPGFFLYTVLQLKKEYAWTEVLVFSFLFSLAANILFMHVLKYLHITVTPLLAGTYFLICSIGASKQFRSVTFRKTGTYERYALYLFLGYFIIF